MRLRRRKQEPIVLHGDLVERSRELEIAVQKRRIGPNGWTCHVCGDYRPDDKISVFSKVIDTQTGFAVTQNVRYCNDRDYCTEKAKELNFLGDGVSK